MRPGIFILLPLLLTLTAKAAAEDTMTGIFVPSFKSLRVGVDGMTLSDPVIALDSDSRILIEFDELADDRRYMRYSLTHCNADWQPSGLVESEFLEGFNMGDVDDYSYSQATTTHYVHYRIALPNEQVWFTVSGNYLLRVYPEQDPETTLLQARFMVSEQQVAIGASVSSITDIDYNASHQQLTLEIDASRIPVQNLFGDLTVVVGQNGRLDNEVKLPHPSRVSGSKAIYDHLGGLIFPAGNEYRRFETISTSYPGMRVAGIEYHDPFYHFTLETDSPRAEEQYSYDSTQHGAFVIREYNSTDGDTEADYVAVHFTLDLPPVEDGGVFLDGDFTCRRFDPESRMTYNRATGLYENTLLLKQGHYNYQYLVARPGDHKGLTAPIEGDKYQTVNRYTVKVYQRRPGERYDRLVGFDSIMSL